MNVILTTGTTGFIGRNLCSRLSEEGRKVRAAIRAISKVETLPSVYETVAVNELGLFPTDWHALRGVSTIVHLAARVHIVEDLADDPLTEFRRINVGNTLSLARQAIVTGVKRFIFISSIGVNGNLNKIPFTENDIENPSKPYAISKYEAELGLREIARNTDMEVVIIRPPLVYGPTAPGNFGSLLQWVNKGIPLPLGAIHNQRSLIALDNLVDFIVTCIDHPAAANQTFLVSDGEDLSTTDLLQRVAQAMGKKTRLFPVPVGLLKLGAALLGKQAVAQRLCGSLQVDISKARRLLGWNPPISVDEGLRRAVQGFKT